MCILYVKHIGVSTGFAVCILDLLCAFRQIAVCIFGFLANPLIADSIFTYITTKRRAYKILIICYPFHTSTSLTPLSALGVIALKFE